MELCRETLEVYLKNNTQRDKVKALNIFKQIVKGLAFLHAQNMVHRDIKPANILFALTNNDSDLCVRIADFGLVREVGNSSTIQVAGTFLYMAPEMGGNNYDAKVDMYSAGLILLELLYNCCGKNHDDILIDAEHGRFPEAFNKELKFMQPLLQNLLSHRPSERPTSTEVLDILRQWVS
jgi:serine/threonine protein kinase